MSNGLKAVLVGNSQVGKSSLSERLERGTFSAARMLTAGGSFATIRVPTATGTSEFGLWDTAGQERFRTIVPLYFHRACLVLVVFSVDSRESFDDARIWHQMARERAPSDVRFFLIGNKTDLVRERVISPADGQAKCDELRMDTYVETSAATGAGCEDLLTAIGRLVSEGPGNETEPVGARPLEIGGGSGGERGFSLAAATDQIKRCCW
jgi:small GTP-binding protein